MTMQTIRGSIAALFLSALWAFALPLEAPAASRPNVVMISIDDLNDWTGSLAGHPQAHTPNIDRLADRGTLFRNAHCQAPICTPSRASLVTGLYPSTSGLYFLRPHLEASDIATRRPNLLQHFENAGYHTMGAGKFHGGNEQKYFQEYAGRMGGFGPLPEKKLTDLKGARLWDWGPFPKDPSRMPDNKIANWAIERLNEDYDRPFFMVAGFWRPHVPMYAPPQWFDLFPIDGIRLPEVREDDRDDVSRYAKTLTSTDSVAAPSHNWFVEHNAWKEAVQAYLASVAFVDHQIGRLLDALKTSPYSDNTIVVLFSDHGWHLGEKQHWAKRTLWNTSTQVPLIVSAPGYESCQVSDRPVGLIDLFPTLLELTKQPARDDLEGRSLVSLLEDPDADWGRPILTTFAPQNHSVRSTRWHYVRYADGSEELYDHKNDPQEWNNLVEKPKYDDITTRLRRALPEHNARPVIGDWQKGEIQAWRKAEQLNAKRDQAK